MRRSTQMLLLGAAVFVIGASVVFLTLSGSGGGGAASAPPTTSTTIAKGTVFVPQAAAPLPATFTIPEGKQAVAVQLPFVSGLAGYAKGGDRVNIYATVEKGAPNTPNPPPLAKLLLANVEVLAVNGPGPGSGTGNTTYLLALDADQAEQAIFFSKFESLWMTLVPKDQPKSTTPGRAYPNAF